MLKNSFPLFSKLSAASWLTNYFSMLALLLLIFFCLIAPFSFWWLYKSGDAAVERAVEAQSAGTFALFGSGLSQDFIDYKLQLYSSVKPEIVTIGSSRVMQFRGAWFRKSYLNMGGVAGNLAELRATINAMLLIHRPEIVIIGIDFWWFLPQWEKDPEENLSPTSGSYNYGLESLKKPWLWLLDGKINIQQLLSPIFGIFGQGFRADRFGIMAQQTNDGFGPDGSWYYTAEISGQKPPFDFQFLDTLKQVEYGIKAFYHADKNQTGPALPHLEAFLDICFKLQARNIKTFIFIPPLSEKVLQAMRKMPSAYPHLFKLKEALSGYGLNILDMTDPRALSSSDCEFVDGFHGGEITYARILRQMTDKWPNLLAYVNMEKLDNTIRDWSGHAFVEDERITSLPEIDFMQFGCKKRKIPSQHTNKGKKS